MSLLTYMEQKAREKGITTCPNCGTPDTWFSLAGKCTECSTPLSKKPKSQRLQFAIEVFTEFAQQYDDMIPSEPKKMFLQLGKAIAYKIQTINIVDNSKLIKFQHLCGLIPLLGSNSFGGAIDAKNMSIQLLETARDPMTVGKSLGAALLCLQFIKGYQVDNEFILETTPTKPVQRQTNQPVSTPTKKNSGCLGMLLTLTFIGALLFFISIYLL